MADSTPRNGAWMGGGDEGKGGGSEGGCTHTRWVKHKRVAVWLAGSGCNGCDLGCCCWHCFVYMIYAAVEVNHIFSGALQLMSSPYAYMYGRSRMTIDPSIPTRTTPGRSTSGGGSGTHLLLALVIGPLTTHASRSRRSTIPTPNSDPSNIWALSTFLPYYIKKAFC